MRKYLSLGMLVLGLMLSPVMVQAVPEGEASDASGVNDTTGMAQGLGALGATPLEVDGWISTNDPDDIDFYSFTGTMNQWVALGINHGDGRGGLDDVDTGLALFAPDQRLIARDNDTMGNDPLIASVRLPMTGTYYVAVTHNDNEPNSLSGGDVAFVDLHLGGELIVGAMLDTIQNGNGADSGDYTLTIVDADVLVPVAHSAYGGGQEGLPFDPGKRRSQLYNGAPRASIGVDGLTFNAVDGDFELESATFGPARVFDDDSLVYFSVDSGTGRGDLDDTGVDLASGNGQRAANVYSSSRNESNELAIEAWRMGYEPDASPNMDALVMGTASENAYPVFQGNSVVDFVYDHTFPVYFTTDDDEFANSESDILVVNSPTDAPHVFKYAAELGLDDDVDDTQIDGLVMIIKDGVLGVAFSLEVDGAFGLSGTAVDDEEGGCYEGTNVYFSPCDGTNELLISGEDLGFQCGGDINALDMMFTPPPPPSSGTGVQGPQGPQGEDGVDGADGADGADGDGFPGPVGPAGPTGEQGEQGEAGPVGPAGPQGEAGQDGANGQDGPASAPAPGQTVPEGGTSTNPLCGTMSVATIPTMLFGLLAMGFMQRRARRW